MSDEEPQFPTYQDGQTFFPDRENAEMENEESNDSSPHWLLIVGVGLVVLGLLARWLWRRR